MSYLLSKAETASLTDWSVRHIERKIAAGELRVHHGTKAGRNGRRESKIVAASLPVEFQMKLAEQRIAGANDHALIKADTNQASLFATPPAVKQEERAALSPAQDLIAQQRLAAIAPMVDFKRRTNGHRPTINTLDGRAVSNLDDLANYLAGQHGVSARTLWRWFDAYERKGYVGLAAGRRSDKGKSRFFEEHSAAGEFAQSKYLAERLSIALTYEAIAREWPRLRRSAEDELPSYTTLRQYLGNLPKPITILAREGDRQFTERCAPYLLTDFKSVRVNQIWVSDHCKHDVWVRNDIFPGIKPDAPLRPWLTAIIDMRSRKAVGAAWCGTPSSHSIGSALRRAILDHGIPETFYIDNGKDYEKVGKIDLSAECSGVLARLGIAPQYCLPKHPQSKLIESWFATLHKRCDAIFKPFYCGTSPSQRPEECDLVLREHAAYLQGKAHSSPLLAASEFIRMAADWVREFNCDYEKHRGRGMDGHTPNEIFEELLPVEKRRVVTAEHARAFDVLFWDRAQRKVLEGGCVQINGERYEPADPQSSAALYLQIERSVIVACDPYDLGQAIALDADGMYLGTLQAQKLIARGPVSHDDIRASMRTRRKFRRAVADYVTGLAAQRHAAGDLTEIDVRRQRAGIANPDHAAPLVLPPMRLLDIPVPEVPTYTEDVVADVRALMKGGR